MSSSAVDSANLILRLYDLRREAVMRKARDWFLREFHPESFEEFQAALGSDKNPYLRMVLGYWEMAASFVDHGAIDPAMFRDANPEILGVFSKVAPFLDRLREAWSNPDSLGHVERVARSYPDADERLARTREALRSIGARGGVPE